MRRSGVAGDRLALAVVLLGVLLVACSHGPSAPTPTTAVVTLTPAATVPPANPTLSPSATVAAPTATPRPTATPVSVVNKRGVHLLLDDGRTLWPVTHWSKHLAYAREAVGSGGYVTQLVRSEDLDVVRWQVFMDLCAGHELVPILRLATVYNPSTHWWEAPETDAAGSYGTIAAAYAAFVSGLEWPTDEHYVVVGNEPNHGNEWGGHPDPAAYARFLVEVATAMRAADPGVRVLNGGLDTYTPHTNGFPFIDGMAYMDAETFMDEMHAAVPDVFEHLDLWASHVYPLGPFSAPPWEQTYGRDMINGATNPNHRPPPPGVFNRGTNGYVWELWKLSTYGVVDLQVMITETGWRHAETTEAGALDAGSWPDAALVAFYLDLAMWGNHGRYPQWPETGWIPWDADLRVVAVTPFALNGQPREWGHTNWLMVDEEGSIQGVYPLFDVWATAGARP
jgi:hypothetical protein